MTIVKLEPQNHEHFEELASLAALGELSPEEYSELRAHLDSCESCKAEYADFEHLIQHQLPVAHLDKGRLRGFAEWFSSDSGLRDRFIAKSRAQNFRFFSGASNEKRSHKGGFPAFSPGLSASALLLFLLTIAVSSGIGYRLGHGRALEQLRSVEAPKKPAETIQLPNDRDESSSKNTSTDAQSGDVATRQQVGNELSNSLARYAALSARYKTVEQQLQDATSQVQVLKAQVESGRIKETETTGNLLQAQETLSQMSQEVQTLSSQHAQDITALNERQARLDEIEREVTAQNGALDRTRKLLTADRDIRDLMGARNLHLTDVYDVDGRGKNRSPYGRVFYTEGKSLIFYAFDLDERKSAAKAASAGHSYQVWGYKEAANRETQSLGILYMDDQKQSRWMLKFDDPIVLREIDSVFVTVEPPGGSQKPTGHQLLYAYLGEVPNHP